MMYCSTARVMTAIMTSLMVCAPHKRAERQSQGVERQREAGAGGSQRHMESQEVTGKCAPGTQVASSHEEQAQAGMGAAKRMQGATVSRQLVGIAYDEARRLASNGVQALTAPHALRTADISARGMGSEKAMTRFLVLLD